MTAGMAQHLGVFCILIALAYVLVRFLGLPPELYYVVAPVFFLYLGAALLRSARRSRFRSRETEPDAEG